MTPTSLPFTIPAGEVVGLIATPWGLLLWSRQGFEPPTYQFSSGLNPGTGTITLGTYFGGVWEDPLPNICVEIYRHLDSLLVAEIDAPHWKNPVFDLPLGRYRIHYGSCGGRRYFDQWWRSTPALLGDQADVVVLRSVTSTYGSTSSHESFSERLAPMFDDVASDSYYFESAIFLRDAGITLGCGLDQYCPDRFVTSEEMASFIVRFWRFFGETCAAEPPNFVDLASDSFAFNDVGCIAGLGITRGTSATEYSPHDFVSRDQMASFLARLWRHFAPCPTTPHPFSDVDPTSFSARDIECIFGFGVTSGIGVGIYDPEGMVTRAQMAAFLDRLARPVSKL